MPQERAWEREYRDSKLVTKGDKPQKDVLRFLRFLKKEGVNIAESKVLDLGSGTGRNSNYIAGLGAEAVGVEIAPSALEIARRRAGEARVKVLYIKQNIGEKLPFESVSFHIALDVVSSNSLNERERETYLAEAHRVLKLNGYFFVKALSKEGDKNAKELLKIAPGKEKDTYHMKELDLFERVWSREDFETAYGRYFDIIKLERKAGYARMNNRAYKRNYWIGYLRRKS